MALSIPDWQLPPGVSRGLWDYLHDPEIARNYDAGLSGSPLFTADQGFAERHFDKPGRLIDLGCGTGRLLVPFARRGYSVFGVDLSREMLKMAGDRAARSEVQINLVQANLVDLTSLRADSMDYAACLFSTLGMIAGRENRRRVIEQVYCLLRPGGKFVLHVHNRWFNFWDPVGCRWLLKDILRSSLRRKDAGDRFMPVHQSIAGLSLHLFTRHETTRLLRSSGFKILEVQPVGLRPDGQLHFPRILGWLRSYGYLLAAQRPTS